MHGVIDLKLDLSFAFLLLNCLARNINPHATIHFHNNTSLNYVQNIDPPRYLWIAVQAQQTRPDIRLQIRVRQHPIRDDIHRDIHPRGPPRLRLPWRSSGLAHHRAVVVQSGAGVTELERRYVGVFYWHVGGDRYVGAGFGDRVVNQLRFGDGDFVRSDNGVFHTENREYENHDHQG